jgi:DNA-binding LacI/PurR family transcriptional regulator
MEPLTVFSAAEQVAAHLRAELLRGNLTGMMPGVNRLAADLGVNRKTVESALAQLKAQGLVVGQGRGRHCRIELPRGHAPPSMRLAILEYDAASKNEPYMIDLMHHLQNAGHTAFYSQKTLMDLKMDVRRVARHVKSIRADAWVIGAGSFEVLEWFSAQPTPAFAMFGAFRGLPIAGVGTDSISAITAVGSHLVKLGHQRIAILTRSQHRLPEPNPAVRAFLQELKTHGIQTGPYNLPDWEQSKEGLQAMLESLFQLTPPTALLIDEAVIFAAVQQFLLKRGIRVPEDVSLVCIDSCPTFAWCEPSVSHLGWDWRLVSRRIQRWANNVARGKDDKRQRLIKTDFVAGGTVGPVPVPEDA